MHVFLKEVFYAPQDCIYLTVKYNENCNILKKFYI